MDPDAEGLDRPHFALYGRTWTSDDAAFQEALARAHAVNARPRCLCRAQGVAMYVARHHRYLVKRLPDTGPQHHPCCPSFEPEVSCSGLGPLMAEAVRETAPDCVELRVDFPWVRLQGHAVPTGAPGVPADVARPRARMSLRALLHFLFERAGFNRWTPAMAGKRNQGVLHKYLMEAAAGIGVQGAPLAERLYVPEPFSEAAKADNTARRHAKLAVTRPQDGRAPLALVIGAYKGHESGDLLHRLWIRHMPDTPLLISGPTWDRLLRAYRPLLEAHDADAEHRLRLVVAALVQSRRPCTYEIDTASLMLTSRDWIPLDDVDELPLIEALVQQQRRFFKPLRYDARSAAAFANALLLDGGSGPLPLHLVNATRSPQEQAIKDRAVQAAGPGVWVAASDRPLPPFPVRSDIRAAVTRTAPA